MANILFGAGIADARGSVGGIVFSHGAGGAIMRTRIKPNNPATNSQVLRRATLSTLVARWSKTLTDVQRTSWDDYAGATPWTNKLRQSIVLTGMQAYLMINGFRLRVALAVADSAPDMNGVAILPSCTITADHGTNNITIATAPSGFVDTNPNNGFAVLRYLQTSAGSIAEWRRPIYAGWCAGNAAPPTFPMNIGGNPPLHALNRLPIGIVMTDIHGRISSEFRQSVPIT